MRTRLVEQRLARCVYAGCRLYSKEKATSSLAADAVAPRVPLSVGELAGYLTNHVLYRRPGHILIVNKPYGISSVGYKQKEGGIFGSSRFDQKDAEEDDDEPIEKSDTASVPQVTIEKALPRLKERLGEPGLSFCTGLKRYVSGPVVLPCSAQAKKAIEASLVAASKAHDDTALMHRAVAICVGKPHSREGEVQGCATFQTVGENSEYVFMPNEKSSKRAKAGKFAIYGRLTYKVLASDDSCSLVDIGFNKFARHMPRLVLSHLGLPILGDGIYQSRLVTVDGQPVVVQPKDRWRSKQGQFEPKSLLTKLEARSLKDIRGMPMYLSVYRSVFPSFPLYSKEDKAELVAMAPPPKHFVAMTKLLGFHRQLRAMLESFDVAEEAEDED